MFINFHKLDTIMLSNSITNSTIFQIIFFRKLHFVYIRGLDWMVKSIWLWVRYNLIIHHWMEFWGWIYRSLSLCLYNSGVGWSLEVSTLLPTIHCICLSLWWAILSQFATTMVCWRLTWSIKLLKIFRCEGFSVEGCA